MGKCKEALEEANGDMELAIDNLRKKGQASAVKVGGRQTNEGMIIAIEKDGVIAFVEVNAETDFVVRNDRFQSFLQNIAEEVAKTKPASLEAFNAQPYSKEAGLSIDQYRATIVQVIGENIVIRRIAFWEKSPSKSIGIYSHLGGKIVVGVEIEGSNKEEALAKDIAMHAAAAAPEFLSPEEVPHDIVEREKEIAKGQVAGKPANIIDKIVDGKLNAYYEGVCLAKQKYIRDDSMTIEQLVEKGSKDCGVPLKLKRFVRWAIGQ
jgi:elongation factor Ts